jgi:hypothetical protein
MLNNDVGLILIHQHATGPYGLYSMWIMGPIQIGTILKRWLNKNTWCTSTVLLRLSTKSTSLLLCLWNVPRDHTGSLLVCLWTCLTANHTDQKHRNPHSHRPRRCCNKLFRSGKFSGGGLPFLNKHENVILIILLNGPPHCGYLRVMAFLQNSALNQSTTTTGSRMQTSPITKKIAFTISFFAKVFHLSLN